MPGVTESNVPVIEFEYKGLKIPIGAARLKCTDVLFDPGLIQKDVPSLPEALQMVVKSSSEPEKRLFLWENIALSGGIASLSGILLKI